MSSFPRQDPPAGSRYPHDTHPGPVSYTHLDVYKRQVVGLLLDRVSLKRSRNASAEVEDVHEGGHRTHS